MELDLGNLLPIHKGDYAGGTAYIIADVVNYNNGLYYCKLASTGNLPTDTTYWIEVMPALGSVDIIMDSGKGLDFSADSKGVFKGLESIVYRLTSDTATGSVSPIINWEIADDTETEFYLGVASQVTESSGTFSFASTGYYWVDFGGRGINASAAEASLAANILATNDNSVYTSIAFPGTNAGAANRTMNLYTGTGIKVTDISNDKIRFSKTTTQGDGVFQGNTAHNRTFARFTKLADI